MCLPVKPFKITREWVHAGLLCNVTQAREGSYLCGYVRVPPTHPWHGLDAIPAYAHGGVNFAAPEPCAHEDGEGWWFGFDCAHAGDLRFDPNTDPGQLTDEARFEKELYSRLRFLNEGHYWTQAEVEAETAELAEQIALAAGQRAA
jgi:hypothetical protein